MAKDPEKRFPSMEAFRKALASCYSVERYMDPSPQVAQQRATSEVERRRAVDPPGPLAPNPTVEDKLANLFGAWSARVVNRGAPTPPTAPAVVQTSSGDLLRRALEAELGKEASPDPNAGLKTLTGYRFRAAHPGPKKTK
jgi:hypothetical protein